MFLTGSTSLSAERILADSVKLLGLGTAVPEHIPAFIDTHGLFAKRYDATPGSSYLFRPDQHLNARWRTLDVNAVRSALSRAACPHAPALATS